METLQHILFVIKLLLVRDTFGAEYVTIDRLVNDGDIIRGDRDFDCDRIDANRIDNKTCVCPEKGTFYTSLPGKHKCFPDSGGSTCKCLFENESLFTHNHDHSIYRNASIKRPLE